MILLKNEKVLIFNNPKCGTTSVRDYIKPYSVDLKAIRFWSPRSNYEYYNDLQLEVIKSKQKNGSVILDKENKPNYFSTIHGHITPLEVSTIIKSSLEEFLVYPFNDYDKICFTRNPWARVYSLWKMVGLHNLRFKNFTDFVDNLDKILHYNPYPVVRHVINGTKHFISDSQGNIIVDRIFKIENTIEFMDYMLGKYNIPHGKFSHKNSRISNFPTYTSQYNSNTIKIIESRYQWEIDYFGYKFGE